MNRMPEYGLNCWRRRYAFAGGVPRILFGESGLVKKYEVM